MARLCCCVTDKSRVSRALSRSVASIVFSYYRVGEFDDAEVVIVDVAGS